MNRTVIPNDLNLGNDAASAAVAMSGIAVAAQRRPHLMEAITSLSWVKHDGELAGVLVETKDRGCAVHLANALGLPFEDSQDAFALPRWGAINGMPVTIDVAGGESC